MFRKLINSVGQVIINENMYISATHGLNDAALEIMLYPGVMLNYWSPLQKAECGDYRVLILLK